ncbi:MAG: TraR/DksA C4-type zinc finger protein [Acidobacteria bacterium]|nr:TraR/DksA C4-type zinc finger protein [Acidobacteriota bacterium]
MTTTTRTAAAAPRPNQARHKDLQVMLQDRQRELQDVLRCRVRGVPSGGAGDGLDETEHAEADIQEHIEVALIQMKGETLQRLREALVRLEAGEYGYCTECDGEISEKRLQALPFAVRCKACEELHEQHTARERRINSPQGFAFSFTQQARS